MLTTLAPAAAAAREGTENDEVTIDELLDEVFEGWVAWLRLTRATFGNPEATTYLLKKKDDEKEFHQMVASSQLPKKKVTGPALAAKGFRNLQVLMEESARYHHDMKEQGYKPVSTKQDLKRKWAAISRNSFNGAALKSFKGCVLVKYAKGKQTLKAKEMFGEITFFRAILGVRVADEMFADVKRAIEKSHKITVHSTVQTRSMTKKKLLEVEEPESGEEQSESEEQQSE